MCSQEIQEKKKKVGLLKRLGAQRTPLADVIQPSEVKVVKPVPKPRSPKRNSKDDKDKKVEETTEKHSKTETEKDFHENNTTKAMKKFVKSL